MCKFYKSKNVLDNSYKQQKLRLPMHTDIHRDMFSSRRTLKSTFVTQKTVKTSNIQNTKKGTFNKNCVNLTKARMCSTIHTISNN